MRSRRRWLLGLGLLIAVVHAVVVTEFGERLRAFARGGSIQAMEVAFVRELKAAPPEAASEPSAPTTESTTPATIATTIATTIEAPTKPSSSELRAPTLVKPKPKPKPKPPRPKPDDEEPPPAPPVVEPAIEPAPLERKAPDDRGDASRPPETQAVTPAVVPSEPRADTRLTEGLEPPAAQANNLPASTTPGLAFDWPPSTQLRYVLKGNYRGEVEGSAKVQWVRAGSRYQVLLEVAIGPSFAPLMSRHMISEGELGANGLAPRRYDERTRIGFSTRQLAMSFDDERAVLANGTTVAAPRGMQDASSQFVQLTYLFTLNPSLLRAGQSVNVPVALPRRVNLWTYDIIGEEMLPTPMGELRTFHVKPRRDSPRQGELVAQAWYAPSLQYLPVRILIHQDVDSWIDLQIEGPPLQAEPLR